MKFPKEFIWGAATSSYQIEGAALHEGGGHSVWDMLGRQQGKIHNGDTGETAGGYAKEIDDIVSINTTTIETILESRLQIV